eukprot:GEMP01083912.1.p1 GENE.GEMP01083912.1~~GEMP01083912.1.p1  ORF type:complete len:146 (+),score=9.52 GEMP01083912.1:25-438(+)
MGTAPDVCQGCNNPIGASNYISAGGRIFHPDCFRCSKCQQPIEGLRFKSSDRGDILCCDCGSPKCNSCSGAIEGFQILAEGLPYHPQCFRCSRCSTPIQGEFEIRGSEHAEVRGRDTVAGAVESARIPVKMKYVERV